VLSFTPIPPLFLKERSLVLTEPVRIIRCPAGNKTPIPGPFNPQPRQYGDGAIQAHITKHDINYDDNNIMEQKVVTVLILCDNYRLLLAITAPLCMLAVSLGTTVT
jgi:hypothetical protein